MVFKKDGTSRYLHFKLLFKQISILNVDLDFFIGQLYIGSNFSI